MERHSLWNSHLRRIDPIGVLVKGYEYETISVVRGVRVRALVKVERIIPGKELVLANRQGLLRYRIAYRLLPEGKSTRLRCSAAVETTSDLFAFAAPLLAHTAREELAGGLHALKLAAEEGLV